MNDNYYDQCEQFPPEEFESVFTFFVMLNHPNGRYIPMTYSHDDSVCFYLTEEEARTEAKKSMLGETYGYEIFEIGRGET